MSAAPIPRFSILQSLVELLRRGLLIVGFLVALALIYVPQRPVLGVRVPLEVKGPVVNPSDSVFLARLAKGLDAMRAGDDSGIWNEWFQVGDDTEAGDWIYMALSWDEAEPLASLETAHNGHLYLPLSEEEGDVVELNVHDDDWTLGFVPWRIAYPGRSYIIWVAALAFAGWLLLPWPRRVPGSLYYGRFAGMIGPDIIATIMGGVFFAIPIMVSKENHWNFFGEGLILAAVMWPLALLGAICFPLSAWYTAFAALPTAEGLAIRTLLGTKSIPWSEVTEARLGVSKTHRWVIRLLWVAALFNPRAAATALTLGNDQYAIELRGPRGVHARLWIQGLVGIERLMLQLRLARVPLSKELDEAFPPEPAPPEQPASAAMGCLGYAIRLALCLVLPAIGVYLMLARPSAADAIPGMLGKPEPPPTAEEYQKSLDQLKRMEELNAELTRVRAEMESATDQETRDAAQKRFWEIMKEIEAIHDGS